MNNENKRLAINQLYVAIHHLEESKKDSSLKEAQEREAKRRIQSALELLA